MASRKMLVLSLMLSLAVAWEFPFRVSFPSANPSGQKVLDVEESGPRPLRIAIIGAGAGGSAAAFWISKARERHGVSVHIDVYEKENYIGGRSTTVYPYHNASLPPAELGASIFVAANRNMARAVKEFNLTLVDFGNDDGDMGIWDGTQFVLSTSGGGWFGWLDNLKVMWRYGYTSCTKAPKLVANMIDDFIGIYTPKISHWPTIEELSIKLGFDSLTPQTGESFMFSQGISELYTHELVEAVTRVNYGQNSDELHALMGLAAMAADGAHSVAGGNFQVFEHFLSASGASVHLNTTVAGLRKTTSSSTTQWFVSTSPPPEGNPIPPYDHIVFATPFQSSLITLLGSLATFDPPVEYIHLHVTLVATTAARPNPAYFGLKAGSTLPSMILTTHDAVRRDPAAPEPEFNSLSYHGLIRPKDHLDGPEWLVKIFSKDAVTDEWLEKVLGEGNVGWVYRKEWDSYPKGVPTTAFPPISPDTGLWYVNSFEPFISTMETETVSARNIINSLFEAQYGAGLCGPNKEVEGDEGGWGGVGADGKIWGWEC